MSPAASTALPGTRGNAVLVAGGSPAAGREAVRLLRAASFELHQPIALCDVPKAAEPSGLVVLLVDAPDRAADAVADACRSGARIVVVMPESAGGAALRRALRSGAAGIVPAGRLAVTLVPTLRAVAAGQLVVPPAVRRQLAPPALSNREKQILRLVVDGYTNKQIADTLYVAESTVKTHLSSAFVKLDTHSRAEAAALITDPEEGAGLGILAEHAPLEDPPGPRR